LHLPPPANGVKLIDAGTKVAGLSSAADPFNAAVSLPPPSAGGGPYGSPLSPAVVGGGGGRVAQGYGGYGNSTPGGRGDRGGGYGAFGSPPSYGVRSQESR